MLKRRLSEDPKAGRSAQSTSANTCPDIWELEDGTFLVIGTDRTEELRNLVGDDVHLDSTERMIVLPRRTLVSAKNRIPSK